MILYKIAVFMIIGQEKTQVYSLESCNRKDIERTEANISDGCFCTITMQ